MICVQQLLTSSDSTAGWTQSTDMENPCCNHWHYDKLWLPGIKIACDARVAAIEDSAGFAQGLCAALEQDIDFASLHIPACSC